MATETLKLISLTANQVLHAQATILKSRRMLKRCNRLINVSVTKNRKLVQTIKA